MPQRWRKTDSNPRSRLSRAARSAADQLGKPGEDKAPDEPRQTQKYAELCSKLRLAANLSLLHNSGIPCIFPPNREFAFGDGFARDCPLQRRVCKPSVPHERLANSERGWAQRVDFRSADQASGSNIPHCCKSPSWKALFRVAGAIFHCHDQGRFLQQLKRRSLAAYTRYHLSALLRET